MRIALSLYSEIFEDFYENYEISKEHYLERYADDWTFLYIRLLQQFGIDTTIYHFSRDARRLESYIHKPTGCTVKFLPSPRLHRWLYYLCYYTYFSGESGFLRRWLYPIISYVSAISLRFVRLLKKDRPDLILQQDYEMGKFDIVALIARMLGIPLVAFFTGGTWPRAEYEHKLRRHTIKIARRVVCMSKEECQRVRETYQLPPEKIDYLPNPVDEEAFQPRPKAEIQKRLGLSSDHRYVLFIGRLLNHIKGVDYLIDAFEKVAQQIPDARLLLVGRGPDEEWLQEYAREKGLSSITFVGWVNKEDLPYYYNVSEMLVLSSNHEGLPLIITEAMSSGIPVVSTDVGGVRDLLVDGETGFLVPCEDVAGLADRMIRLLSNNDEREHMGAAGRKLVEEQFTRQVVGQRLANILRECASEPGMVARSEPSEMIEGREPRAEGRRAR
jgi:glycosyltransferase involved in cell wall biosynthesis